MNTDLTNKKISFRIRTRYSLDEEFAILRQRDTKPDEFMEYNAFCEECKRVVREEEAARLSAYQAKIAALHVEAKRKAIAEQNAGE